MTKIRYKSNGVVLGNLWGGGTGAYPATKLEAPSKEKLIEVAKKALADKSLDSGHGFESLKGALLRITVVTTKVIKGKTFTNEEHIKPEFIGELTEDEEIFLTTVEA